jgi:hypothetical protein
MMLMLYARCINYRITHNNELFGAGLCIIYESFFDVRVKKYVTFISLKYCIELFWAFSAYNIT